MVGILLGSLFVGENMITAKYSGICSYPNTPNSGKASLFNICNPLYSQNYYNEPGKKLSY
jgi:hypothetical protein